MARKPPKKPPLTKAERAKLDEQRHWQAQGAKIIKADKRAIKRDADAETERIAEALRSDGHWAATSRNTDTHEETRRSREISSQVDDLIPLIDRVSIGVDQHGRGWALLRFAGRSAGLLIQFVTAVGRLFGRGIDTNYVDQIKSK